MKNMGKHKRRKDGRLAEQVFIGYQPNGKRKWKTVYAKTEKELEAKVREIKNKIDSGLDLSRENITVGEWGLQWLKVYKNNVSGGTYAVYENSLRNHIIPAIGDTPIAKLKPIQVQAALNQILNEGHVRTAEFFKLTIKQMLQKAVSEGIVLKNICDDLEKIKADRQEKRVLTEFERRCISRADFTKKERLFLDLLYYTGIRRGEALALSVADINREARTIHISHSLDIRENTPKLKEPKTKAGYRDIPLPEHLFQELMEYISENNCFYLFTSKDRNLITRSSFRRMWDGILKKTKQAAEELQKERKQTGALSEITDDSITFTPHIFRHTYATNLYYAGIDIKRCQYLLGHSSLDITLEIYTHIDNKKNSEDAAEKINRFFVSQMLVK